MNFSHSQTQMQTIGTGIEMQTIITDGGRPAVLTEEYNDCTIRAAALAGRIDYELVYIVAEDCGRRPSNPFPIQYLLSSLSERNMLLYFIDSTDAKTVAQFVKQNKTGRYIIRMASGQRHVGHVAAVIDGVLHDNSRVHGNKKVKSVWRVF